MQIFKKIFPIIFIFLLGCSPEPSPEEIALSNARHNFLSKFQGAHGALRTWECKNIIEKRNGEDVVACEFILKRGYVKVETFFCSIEKNKGCY